MWSAVFVRIFITVLKKTPRGIISHHRHKRNPSCSLCNLGFLRFPSLEINNGLVRRGGETAWFGLGGRETERDVYRGIKGGESALYLLFSLFLARSGCQEPPWRSRMPMLAEMCLKWDKLVGWSSHGSSEDQSASVSFCVCGCVWVCLHIFHIKRR